MVHIIKVYFTGPKQNLQIRRLAVNSDVVSRFDLLAKKIKEMFPGLAQGHIEVTWKDAENDVIHMSSDEELAQALASADDDILRIYAYSVDNQHCDDRENQNIKSSHNEVHQNVICDSCDKIIHGYRYKCLQCRNFDLCSVCNAADKHENHDMIKLMRPTHVSREWVFPGARKLWKSMFGRCPSSYFATSSAATSENEKTAKSDSQKNQWPGLIDDLLKGGYVSADKLIKDNLGNFMNFIESVSGNLDVKLESGPPKPSPCSKKQDIKTDEKKQDNKADENKQDNKTDEKTNNGSLNPEPKSADASHQPKKDINRNSFNPSKEQKAALDNFAKTVMHKAEQFSGEKGISAVGNSVEKKQTENPAKPCGLFGDNEFSDGWTILNKQEDEKKDATAANENGAKPKYPSIYPSVFENIQPCEILQGNAGDAVAETKIKGFSSTQTCDAQAAPKPPTVADNENKYAKLDQKENSTTDLDPEIMNALVKMQAMGFTNEGGWLERLLLTKDGNINATLDALYPNTRRQ